MTNKLIKAGDKFGELTVIQRVRDAPRASPNLRKKVLVECSCGKRLTVPDYYLTRKSPEPKKDCGHGRQTLASINYQEHRIWYMMNIRTTNPNHRAWKHYGGRGIKVCEEWSWDRGEEGFAAFLAYIGPRPTPYHTIDRVDNDLGYQPYQADGVTRQVRWATAEQQRANQRPRKPSGS